MTKKAMIDELCDRYDATPQKITKDVETLLAHLTEAEIIEEIS
jgi:nucleoid DNA-binding protein